MPSPTVSYRVEEKDGRFHLYFIRQDGSEFFFHDYDDLNIARYNGIRGSQKAPTTDDGIRARRKAMRAG